MITERSTMNGKPVFTVPAKTVINFDSRFDKKLLCDGITFTAGSACTYSCSFCYVPDMQRKAREWHEKNGVQYPQDGHAGVVIRIKDAVDVARKQLLSKPEEFRNARKVIYASPKVDVAGNMDLVRETVEICKVILDLTDWDIRLLSKSNLLPKVAEAIDEWSGSSHTRARMIYGVSTGTLDDKLAAAFEQGTAKVSQRIKSLHWLQDNGYRTYGMICPSLPQPSPKRYDTFVDEMLSAIRVEKCEHVWAEVLNARGDSFTRTLKAISDAGFEAESTLASKVFGDQDKWELYAQETFLALDKKIQPSKLRFMQYVNKENELFWKIQSCSGGVVIL
jgi:DNA repair photolyase